MLPIIILTTSALILTKASPLLQRENDQERIIGGALAKPGEFPWQAAVYFDRVDGSFFCGGTLLSELHVLTAGHCVVGATTFSIHLGAVSLVDPNRVLIAATQYYTVPTYNPATFEDDVGLIKLTKQLTFNDLIKPINLPSSAIPEGKSVIVSGWGATGNWSGEVSDLHYATLHVISNEECKSTYGDQITTNMVCAKGTKHEGVCQGDSGGPLEYYDENKTRVLGGIVLFASSSGCNTNHPSGFTRVFPYIDWIQQIIFSGSR